MTLLDAAFPALMAARLRWRARPLTGAAELDDHMRRDIGLPPRVAVPKLTAFLGLR